MAHDAPLPDLDLPLRAVTSSGELVRIRHMAAEDTRPDTSSEYDDWGEFDITFDEDVHGRALIEVAGPGAPDEDWVAVGDLSWHSELHGPNLASRAVSIGVALAAGARGRGIGAVAQGLLALALHDAGIHRVQASTDVQNTVERRSLATAGFVLEGILRAAQVRADGRHDLALFSCLPGEPTARAL
jgi:RimJ/RimL family protein N-acetyltransferase